MPGKTPIKKKVQSIDSEQEFLENLGARIKERRLAQGYTSAEIFAYENGFGRSQYAKWEKGTNMEVLSLRKLAVVHGITISELFDGIK